MKPIALSLLFALSAWPQQCDLNRDGKLDVLDIAAAHRQARGLSPVSADLDNDQKVTVVDFQRLITAVLGGKCTAVPSMPRFSWTSGGKQCVSVFSFAPIPVGGSSWIATCR
jgi:hypothetical protein